MAYTELTQAVDNLTSANVALTEQVLDTQVTSVEARDTAQAFAIDTLSMLVKNQAVALDAPRNAEEAAEGILADTRVTRVKGNAGTTYSLIAGGLQRNTVLNPNWRLLRDAVNVPVNLDEPTLGIDLQLNFSGKKIGAVVIGVDDHFAACGITAGAAVAADKATVRMGAPCSLYYDLISGNAIVDPRLFKASKYTLTIQSDGKLILLHPWRQLNMLPLVQWTNGPEADLEVLYPYDIRNDFAGQTSLYLKRRFAGRISWDGTAWSASNTPFQASDYTFVYDAPTGVLTVTHPVLAGNITPTLTAWGFSTDEYHVSALNSAVNTFKARFRKLSDGSIPTVPPVNMGFYFDRGVTCIDKAPHGALHVHLGHVQVDMADVSFSGGNLWPLALVEA